MLAVPLAAQEAPPAAEAPAGTVTTLREAMALAYNTSPDLAGERASLRATDEGVPIARSAGLPGVTSTAGVNQSIYDTDQGIGPTRTGTLGANVSVPIYCRRSGAQLGGARPRRGVAAGPLVAARDRGRRLHPVATVYVDVIRDQAIVQLNQRNVKALEVNLQATRDRFEVGDLTRTDVAQSEARYALAQSQLRSAEARLIGSRENFIRVVGAASGRARAAPGAAEPARRRGHGGGYRAGEQSEPRIGGEAARRIGL